MQPRAAKEVAALLGKGSLFRQGYDNASLPVSTFEKELAAYMGFKFCVAVNSYSSALFLALRAVGVENGAKVLCNGVAGRAVASAVQHAGAAPVPVESMGDLRVDAADLAWKADQSGAQYLLLSHVCGVLPELDTVTQICRDRGVRLLEDCADSLGVWVDGRHVGHHGGVCCISAQPGTVLNAGQGKGGFVLTDDPAVAARTAAMAGCYGPGFRRHFAATECPALEEIERGLCPDFGLQMSNVAAAVLRPQLSSLEHRVLEANRRHARLASRLLDRASRDGLAAETGLRVAQPSPQARPCCTSLLLWVDSLGVEASARLVAAAQARGVPLQALGSAAGGTDRGALDDVKSEVASLAGQSASSAAGSLLAPRSGYLCPRTAALLRKTYLLGIPPRLSRGDCDRAADALAAALGEASAVERAGSREEVSPAYRRSSARAQQFLPYPSEGSQSAAASVRSVGGASSVPFSSGGCRSHARLPEGPLVSPQVPVPSDAGAGELVRRQLSLAGHSRLQSAAPPATPPQPLRVFFAPAGPTLGYPVGTSRLSSGASTPVQVAYLRARPGAPPWPHGGSLPCQLSSLRDAAPRLPTCQESPHAAPGSPERPSPRDLTDSQVGLKASTPSTGLPSPVRPERPPAPALTPVASALSLAAVAAATAPAVTPPSEPGPLEQPSAHSHFAPLQHPPPAFAPQLPRSTSEASAHTVDLALYNALAQAPWSSALPARAAPLPPRPRAPEEAFHIVPDEARKKVAKRASRRRKLRKDADESDDVDEEGLPPWGKRPPSSGFWSELSALWS